MSNYEKVGKNDTEKQYLQKLHKLQKHHKNNLLK